MIRSDECLNGGFERFHERATAFDRTNVCESSTKLHKICNICNKHLNRSNKTRFCRDCMPVNSKKRKLVQESDSDE